RPLKLIEVFPRFDFDVHCPGKACQVPGTGIRHYGNAQLRDVSGHRGTMLEHKRALSTVKSTFHALHCDIPGRPLNRSHDAEHFTVTDGFEIALEVFVDRKRSTNAPVPQA